MNDVVEHDFRELSADGGRALRDAFGCFTTGVTIVTTLSSDGRPVGYTANSFASVSLDPPLALTSIDLGASTLPHLELSRVFAVNILHIDQQPLAKQFTSKTMDRFEGVEFETWDSRVPILKGCMANFEMKTEHAFDAGDHKVIVGRILRVRHDRTPEPLVFLRGRYRRMHAEG